MNRLWNLVMRKFELEEATLAAIVMRNIWHYRNLVIFEKKFKVPQLVVQVATNEREEYTLALERTNHWAYTNQMVTTGTAVG